MKLSIMILAFSAVASGQTLHVTGTHKATDAEKTYKTSFGQNLITGDIDGKHYTLEQLQTWGTYHFQVGSDYLVVKLNDSTVKVRVLDKKGKETTESLNVVSVSE